MTSIPYIICKTFISMLIVSTLTTTATTTKHVYNIYTIYIYMYIQSLIFSKALQTFHAYT